MLLKSWLSDRGKRESWHQQKLQDILATEEKIAHSTAVTHAAPLNRNSLNKNFASNDASIAICNDDYWKDNYNSLKAITIRTSEF